MSVNIDNKKFRLLSPDPKNYKSVPTIGGFVDYFNDRYRQLEMLIKKKYPHHKYVRYDTISEKDGTHYVFMRARSIVQKKNSYHITWDSPQGTFFTVILKQSTLKKNVEILLNDVCVGLKILIKNSRCFVKEIYWPGYETEKINSVIQYNHKADSDVLGHGSWVLVLSDIHIGSKQFFPDQFNRLIDYCNSNKLLKYVLIVGDIVEGVGIYPNQIKNLVHHTVHEQYLQMASYFKRLRGDIEIYACPGNHDYVPLSQPQVFNKSFLKYFPKNTTLIPNPALFKLEGRTIAMYHGASMDILVANIEKFEYSRPLQLMKHYMRMGHLAPSYGLKNVNLPLKRDAHVLTVKPEIFLTGHIHCYAIEKSGGTLYINAGTWQKPTAFMKRMNIGEEVQPCQGIFFNLKNTKEYVVVNFAENKNPKPLDQWFPNEPTFSDEPTPWGSVGG